MSSLSHDADWIASTDRDPLYLKTLSARIAIEQLNTNRWLVAQTSFPLPLLIMQGTADRYADQEVNVDFARRLKGDVTLKVWKGLGHELHNELTRDEVLRYVRSWLDAHVG